MRIMNVYRVGVRLIFLLSMLLWVANPAMAAKGYQLTIITEPAHAKVTILNTSTEYAPGVLLPSGRYNILVSAPGYQEEKGYIEIQSKEWVGRVVLQKSAQHDDPDLTAIDLEWQRINMEKMALQKSQSQLSAERLVFEQQKVDIENQKKKIIMQQIELAQAQYEVDAQRLEISEKLNRLDRLEKSAAKIDELQQQTKLIPQKTQPTIKPKQESKKPIEKSKKPLQVNKPKVENASTPVQKPVIAIAKLENMVAPKKSKSEAPRAVITEKQFINLVNNSKAKALSTHAKLPTANPKKVGDSKLQKLVVNVMADLKAYQPKKMAKKKNSALKNQVKRLKALAPGNTDVKLIQRLYKKRYIVVVGLFTKKNRSVSLTKKLKKQGFTAYYEQANTKNGKLYRVAVGLFEKRSQGLEAKKLLLENMKIKDTILRVFKN
jgi:cell division septation protein DedD